MLIFSLCAASFFLVGSGFCIGLCVRIGEDLTEAELDERMNRY